MAARKITTTTKKAVAARTRRGSRVVKAEATQTTKAPEPTSLSRFWKSQTQVSFLLGLLVVAVLSFLLFRYFEKPNDQALTTPQPTSADQVSQGTEASSASPASPMTEASSIIRQTPQGTAQNVFEVKPRSGTYTVKAGDTLWSIAEKELGSGYRWQEIAQANKLSSPGVITEGTTLTLPKTEATAMSSTETKGGDLNGQAVSSYTIAPGETLWSISQKVYGDPYLWQKIAQANNLTHPSLIHSGNVLTIPPKS